MTKKSPVLLVVDDRPDNLFIIEQLVNEYIPSCIVHTAKDADVGFEMAIEYAPDGILSDIQMPGRNGIDLCAQLKGNPQTSQIPVLLITAHKSDPNLRAKGLDAGADDFIARPIDNLELAARIKVMFRIKHVQDELLEAKRALEQKVAHRTAELIKANEELKLKVADVLEAEKTIRNLHQQIELVFGVTKTSLVIIDSGYNIRYMNSTWTKLHGELAERKCYEYFKNRDIECKDCGIREALKTRQMNVREYVPENDINRLCQVSSIPFKDASGEWLVAEVNVDISKIKQTMELLRKEKDRAQQYLDLAGVMFVALNKKGEISLINRKGCEILNVTEKEVLGQNWFENFVPRDTRQPLHEVFEKLMDGEIEPVDLYENLVLTNTGEEKMLLFHNTILKETNGDVEAILFSGLDITEQIATQEEKKNLENRLQQAHKMESIGTLAGGIAHDFNNILTAILGYTEMAIDDCQPGSTILKDLNEVLGAGNRAKGLVQQILAFSRQDDMERAPIQPVSILQEVIQMLRPSLPTTIEITQNIDAVTSLVFVDPSQLNQILMNLCTNAFHAMEDTGGKLDISLKEVTLSNEDLVHEPDITTGTFIQLSIADSGTGIAPTAKDKIFDPYFTTKETGKGTGMGLAMVHGIVKDYGGFISFYSKLGEGTVFHVFLPTVEQEALTENKINDQIPVGRERILFVDDEEILSQMGKTMLERLGYHVTIRNSSLEALETFQNQPDTFDIVITDQTMPGMTGSDLSRRMLQIRPDIPIILCTGYSTIISEKKAKSMGIKEFALKPLAKKDIAKLIRKVLDVS